MKKISSVSEYNKLEPVLKESRLSIKDFCKTHGLHANNFEYWRKMARLESVKTVSAISQTHKKCIPIKIKSDDISTLIKTPLVGGLQDIRIGLPSGLTLTLPITINPDLLVKIIHELRVAL